MLLESEHIATLGSTTRARAWTTRTVLSPPRCCVCLSARSAVLLDGGSSSAAAGLASSAVALAFVPSPRLSRPGASSLWSWQPCPAQSGRRPHPALLLLLLPMPGRGRRRRAVDPSWLLRLLLPMPRWRQACRHALRDRPAAWPPRW